MLDGGTLARIRELGGIRAIAISHPHFYSRMADWAEEFDATIYVHEADRQWVMQPSSRILYWTGACCRSAPRISRAPTATAAADGGCIFKIHAQGEGHMCAEAAT